MTTTARHIASILLLLIAVGGISRAKEPKIAKRLNLDSTIFTLTLEPDAKPTIGKSFKVCIHVEPKEHIRVWSSTMDSGDCYCLEPLRVTIPDSIANYLELTNLKEISNPITRYDSNFLETTKTVTGPFDLVATIKVKENAPSLSPFYFWVTYACVSEKYCFPATTFAVPMNVIGEKPLMLKIAAKKAKSKGHAKLLAINKTT